MTAPGADTPRTDGTRTDGPFEDEPIETGLSVEAAVDDAHQHGPQPSFEWMIEGDQEMVIPHLKAIAPTLIWEDEHFHVQDVDPVDADLPALRQIELGDEPVGALDFLPLPQRRTLMRLFLCSDLGTTCSLENGNDVIQGFATAWIQRLAKLGFMTVENGGGRQGRPMGFPIPEPDTPSEGPPPDGAPLETAAKSEPDPEPDNNLHGDGG